jgi:hypothetical protein
MKSKTIINVLLGALLFCSAGISAMDWPVNSGEIVRNFGSNEEGMPNLGVCFRAEGPVRAADAGELLFINDPANGASGIPSPMGAWIAIDHRDGLLSIYSRFDDTSSRAPSLIEKDSILTTTGKSGWSDQTGVCFSLFDRRERRWVNPAMIISPREDTIPPNILAVYLKNFEGNILNLSQIRTITQGRYTVFVETSDTIPGNNNHPLAPNRIICSLNGIELGTLNFETFSVRDGILMVYRNSLAPARQVYAAFPAFEVADIGFTRGQATLEIIVQDINGNTRNVTYRLQVD